MIAIAPVKDQTTRDQPRLGEAPRWLIPIATAILWCVAAQILYQPFTPHRLDILDFPELFPLLRAAEGFQERFVRTAEYYATRGRASVATYALIVLNYELWGENTIGWQLTRAMQLAGASVLLYTLLKRWGASALGSAFGAMLVVCSRSGAANWTKLIAGESAGFVVILSMLLVSTGFTSSKRQQSRIAATCVLLVVLLALKEIWIATLPAIWLVALSSSQPGRWGWAKPSRAHWALMVSTSVTGLVCLAPIAVIALNAPADSYASLYGEQHPDPGVGIARYVVTLFPFVPVAPTFNAGALLSDAAIFVLVAVGWRSYARKTGVHSSIGPLITIALLLPLLGVLSYLPWPAYQDFYVLPFLVGTAVIVAFGLTGFSFIHHGTIHGMALAGVPLLFMLTSAHYSANRSRAAIELAHEVVDRLAATSASDTIAFAMRGLPPRKWFGLSATLARQAVVNRSSFPPAIDIPCDVAKKLLDRSIDAQHVVAFHSQCGALGPAQQRLTVSFSWFDWSRGRIVRDSASADLFGLF